MISLRSKQASFSWTPWVAIMLLLSMACGSAKEISELPYRKRKSFEHYYFEASKQKILEDYPRAISLFHLALKEFPNSHASMHQLGMLYYFEGEMTKAEEWSLKAVGENPEYNHWYYLQLASVYTELGKFEASAGAYIEMIRFEPEEQELYIQASAQYVNAGLGNQALKMLDRLEDQCGVSEESATRREFLLMHMGQPEAAVQAIERLVEAFPEELRFRGYLAETMVNARQKERAIAVLEELLAQDSSFGRGHQMLHQLYKEKGDIFKAYTHLLSAFRSQDVPLGDKLQLFTPYYLQMGMNNLSRNMVMELSDVLLEVHPASDVPYIVKGDVYTHLDSLHLARRYFALATERPTDHQTWNKLISVDGRLGRLDLQIADAQKAIERFPNVPGFYLAKGLAEYDSGLYKQSVSSCMDGLDLAIEQRDQVELHACLATAYDAMGLPTKSDEHYEEALRIDPSNSLIMNNYAYALAVRGHSLDKALAWADAALEQEPVNPYYLDTKAWVLYRLGRGSEAIPLLERALLLDSDGRVYLEHLAEIHHSLGNADLAWEYLKKAQALGSTLMLP